MPETVRLGNRGPAVTFLQAQLNIARPDLLPPLAVDGIFGQKTHARVVQFQRDKGLAVDGIVGPKTWAALLEPRPPVPLPSNPAKLRRCGNPDESNKALVIGIERDRQASSTARLFEQASFKGGIKSAGFLPSAPTKFANLVGHIREPDARAVYGTGLDYTSIVFSNAAGLQGRPFTHVALGLPPKVPHVQVLNVGTLTPGRALTIHELAHAWQSQHASNPAKFMKTCGLCMANAGLANAQLALVDTSLVRHPDFPTDFPMSAYAYQPGHSFAAYGAEQIASQCEDGVTAITSFMSSKPPGFSDTDNEFVLNNTSGFEDRRRSGVVFGGVAAP